MSWFNYGMSFEETEERKERLGCFKECLKVINNIKINFLKKLVYHKDFLNKQIHEMEGTCEQ